LLAQQSLFYFEKHSLFDYGEGEVMVIIKIVDIFLPLSYYLVLVLYNSMKLKPNLKEEIVMKNRSSFIVKILILILFIFIGCDKSQSQKKSAPRTAAPAGRVATFFNYDNDGYLVAQGIPSGFSSCYSQPGSGNDIVGPKGIVVAVASGAEIVKEDGQACIKADISIKNTSGNEVAKVKAWFAFGVGRNPEYAGVIKTIVNDRFASHYIRNGLAGWSIPTIETYDLETNQLVQLTKGLEYQMNYFQYEEYFFKNGKQVGKSACLRQTGTGLLVDEKILDGYRPYDYHPYEIVMIGWPDGSSVRF